MNTVVAQSVALRRQSEIVSSLKAATEYLLSKQSPEGYWIGELEADTSLESDYILLQLWLYPPKNDAWNPPTARLIKRGQGTFLVANFQMEVGTSTKADQRTSVFQSKLTSPFALPALTTTHHS